MNYIRNHASAAHPNQNELSGHGMIAWLSNCLKAAITAQPEKAVIVTKRLPTNIRTVAIPEKKIPAKTPRKASGILKEERQSAL